MGLLKLFLKIALVAALEDDETSLTRLGSQHPSPNVNPPPLRTAHLARSIASRDAKSACFRERGNRALVIVL